MPLLNRVLVVEDHPVFLKGLIHLLASESSFQIVGEAPDRRRALEALSTVKPDVVVLDLSLGDDDGLDLMKDILYQSPEMKILVLSMHDEKFYAERSLAAGALGYCMKGEAVTMLVEALKTVSAGKVWISPRMGDLAELLQRRGGWALSVSRLSDREFQVFSLIGKGLGTAEIASRLHLSVKTVGAHKENMKAKLGCQTTKDIRQLAIEWQLGARV